MMRYGMLFAAALLVAGVGSQFMRGPRPVVPERRVARAGFEMALEVRANRVVASASSVPVGTPITLTIRNSSSAPARVRLAGYEDRVDTGELAPGEFVRLAFVADRPGERFAWWINEEPRGRFDVTGSHLVEGHR